MGIHVHRIKDREALDRRRSRMASSVKEYTVTDSEGNVRVKQLNSEDAVRLEKLGYDVVSGRHPEGKERKTRPANKSRGGDEEE